MGTHLLQDAVVAQAQLLLLHPLQTLQNALVNRVLAKFSQGGGFMSITCSCCSNQRSEKAILLSCPSDFRPL